jgi:hypothetical protein
MVMMTMTTLQDKQRVPQRKKGRPHARPIYIIIVIFI